MITSSGIVITKITVDLGIYIIRIYITSANVRSISILPVVDTY